MSITRRTMVAGGAAFLAGSSDAAPLVLTPAHAGRYMRTREGERVGPIEYDAAAFGHDNDKHWRGQLGWTRAYYSANGRVIAGEDGPNDVVGEWPGAR
jgi:hypothetical protein